MKNRDKWHPSKYVYHNGKLIGSRDINEVSVGSRLVVDIVAKFYDHNLSKHAQGKLLDLGCGKAPLYHAYRQYVTETTCVDWANSSHKNDYLDFECDLSKTLPLKDGEFDTIILSDVLEHLPQPELLWNEMTRVLSPNGKIIVNVPFYYCLHERPYDFYRYTEYALRRFVAISGLRLIQLEELGGSPEVLADFLAKHFQFIPIVGHSLAIAIQYLTGLFVQTRFGQKASKRTSKGFPLGYFLVAEKLNKI